EDHVDGHGYNQALAHARHEQWDRQERLVATLKHGRGAHTGRRGRRDQRPPPVRAPAWCEARGRARQDPAAAVSASGQGAVTVAPPPDEVTVKRSPCLTYW